MIKIFLKKIKTIWSKFTLIRLMRISTICLIVLVIKNLTIKFFELDIKEYWPFITVFVVFGLIRLVLMNYILDNERFTKKDIIFICLLVILCFTFYKLNILK